MISLLDIIYSYLQRFVHWWTSISFYFQKQNVDETNEPQIINNIQPVQQQQQQQPVQQYTITLDGKTLKSNQIHYKIEPTGAITIQEPQYVQQTPSTQTQHTIR